VITVATIAWAALSAFFAGAINALAGGGTLITFPALIALGISPLAANMTSTIALCPGFFGAALTQRNELRGQRRRIMLLMPTVMIGGAAGAYILRHTGAGAFNVVAPFLVLIAVGLLAVGPALQRRLRARQLGAEQSDSHSESLTPAVFISLAVAIYGGYFGAGMSVMFIALLAVLLRDSFVRITALKQLLALAVNAAAALYLLADRQSARLIAWPVLLAMAISAVGGGAVGAKLNQRIPERALRITVIVIGVLFAVVYWLG
jgi:uncharacterized protein